MVRSNWKSNALTNLNRESTQALSVALAAGASLHASPANAALIIQDFTNDPLNATVGNPIEFDLNQDGTMDYTITISPEQEIIKKKGGAKIRPEGGSVRASKIPSQNGFIIDNRNGGGDGFADLFASGDLVGVVGPGGSSSSNFARLYTGPVGPFGSVGDRGFIGLFLRFTGGGSDLFGWAEIERGSLSVLRVGFEDTGEPALIPRATVSSPATIPLIALGAAGLAAVRRNRSKTA